MVNKSKKAADGILFQLELCGCWSHTVRFYRLHLLASKLMFKLCCVSFWYAWRSIHSRWWWWVSIRLECCACGCSERVGTSSVSSLFVSHSLLRACGRDPFQFIIKVIKLIETASTLIVSFSRECGSRYARCAAFCWTAVATFRRTFSGFYGGLTLAPREEGNEDIWVFYSSVAPKTDKHMLLN